MTWTTSYSRPTVAAPGRVWSVLADIRRWGEWNDGIERLEVDLPPDGLVTVGTTFWMTPPGEDTLTSTIAVLDEGRELTDVTEVEGIAVRVTHLVEPDAGGTTITYRVEVSGHAPDDVLAEIGTGASADFPQVLAALAARAEASP